MNKIKNISLAALCLGGVLFSNSSSYSDKLPAVNSTLGAGLSNPSGSLLIAGGAITNAMLAGSIQASKLVGTDIATLGTVTIGTWHATKIGLAYGGTNLDMTATGGTSQVLKQTSLGGAITVAQLALADISGWGTGVATALGVNVGSAGAIVVNGGALGTPSSGTATNLSGTATGLKSGDTLAATTSFNLSGTLTPTALSGDVNDYNPTGLSTALALRIDGGAADRTISGLAGGVDGRIIEIINIGTTNDLILTDQDTNSTTAADRFLLTSSITIPINMVLGLRYDGTTQRWRPLNRTAASGGSGTITSVALGAGLTKTQGTENSGSDTITTSGTVWPQVFPVNRATSCTVNTNCNGGVTDESGEIIIATGANPTYTLPNPASGTKGKSYQFGSDGTNGFTLTTVGGSAFFYGCTPVGASATSLVVELNVDVLVIDDGSGYKCLTIGTRVIPVSLTVPPGINPDDFPIANFPAGRIVTGMRCTPEVLAGGTATVDIYKAPSATQITAGTKLNTTAFNANSGLYTDQDLGVTVSTLAAGDRIGLKSTQTTIWTSSGIAKFVCTVFVR